MELELDRLSKHYGNKIAVDRMSLKMQYGVYGLLGANGAGKTTLMRMLCGLLTPTEGEVKLNGVSNIEMGEKYRELLGYLPQDFGYYPDFSAQEFLLYIASLKGLSKFAAAVRAKQLLEEVGLSEVALKKIKSFSGGMKQRLGIAQAMLNNPQILIMDEPTAGLDPKERVRFRNLLANYAKERIVILSTHIVSDIEYIADTIFIMKKGALLLQGTVEELTKTAEGKVYSCTAAAAEADAIMQKYCIANLHHNGSNVEMRIVTNNTPPQNAVQVKPTLEDLYLYSLAEEGGQAL